MAMSGGVMRCKNEHDGSEFCVRTALPLLIVVPPMESRSLWQKVMIPQA
jgi:hypothetical protein